MLDADIAGPCVHAVRRRLCLQGPLPRPQEQARLPCPSLRTPHRPAMVLQRRHLHRPPASREARKDAQDRTRAPLRRHRHPPSREEAQEEVVSGGDSDARRWMSARASFFLELAPRSSLPQHGVGNWKTILSDPDLKFDNRSPVDLKDR
jgi:hypothetical protein